MRFADRDQELDFIERAAIMEYDGGLSREEAERRATKIVEGKGHELTLQDKDLKDQIEMDLGFQQFRQDWRKVLGGWMMKRKWICDVCIKEDYWGDNWTRYSSIAHDETCPYDVPCFCSDSCRKIGEQKLKSGEWQLPILIADAGGFTVTHPRKGY